MTTLYGFIVAAFLVNIADDKPVIPFASMQACETARELLIEPIRGSGKKYYVCVSTGR